MSKRVMQGLVVFALLWTILIALSTLSGIVSGKPFLETTMYDTKVYHTAAVRLQNHQPLYEFTADEAWWQYPPPGTIFFIPLTWFDTIPGQVLWMITLCLSYVVGALLLMRLLRVAMPDYHIPLAVPFFLAASSDFAGTVIFGNIAPILFLFAVIAAWAVLRKQALPLAVVIAILLFTKWYWLAFPLALMLFSHDRKFILRTAICSVVSALVVLAIYFTITGAEYGLQSFADYAKFASNAAANFPWTGPEAMFNTLNNSVVQTVYRYLGVGHPLADILRWVVLAAAAILMSGLTLRAWKSGATFNTKADVVLLIAFGWYQVAMLALIYIPDLIISPIALAVLWRHREKTWWRTLFWLMLPAIVLVINQYISVIGAFGNIPLLVIGAAFPLLLTSIIGLFGAITLYITKET